MSTNVASVTSHFPSPQNGFTTTLSSTISAGAATVPLNSTAGYTNGQTVVFVIDPTDATKKQTFTGIIDTTGNQVTSAVWTAGTNVQHTAGATVVDYATATHIAMISKGIQVSINQDGTFKNNSISSSSMIATGVVTSPKKSTALQQGWESSYGGTTFPTPNTITYNGNRSYTCVFNSVDLTGAVSNGMRVRLTRSVAAPTQCTSLNGTTQYYSKTSPAGMTFTGDHSYMAWVKLSSYAAGAIISRDSNSVTGWSFDVTASGQIESVFRDGANTTFADSYQSIPLNKWVHLAVSVAASTKTFSMYIDGVLVPSTAASGTATTVSQGSQPLMIGAKNSGTTKFFPGKIAQAAVFSAALSQATIQSYISQGLAGTETSLISAYPFNNSINDLNANANNLTANGSATATNADSPFGGQAGGSISSTLDYGIVTSASFSTNTTLVVQVAEGCTIPTSGGVASIVYSPHSAPYGFPRQEGKWKIILNLRGLALSTTNNTWNSGATNGSAVINLPIGEWAVAYNMHFYSDRGATTQIYHDLTFSTSNSTESDATWTAQGATGNGSAATYFRSMHSVAGDISLSAATPYYMVGRVINGDSGVSGSPSISGLVTAKCAYL